MLYALVPVTQSLCTPSSNPEVTGYGTYDGCSGWNVVDTYSCNSPPCGTAEGWGYPPVTS